MQPLSENAVNVPAFLSKLWKMVNDPCTNHLICWSPAGNSFIIQNQAQFWYDLLPLYYKHNNMSSFVRQLNMYGFHKMSTVENGTMENDKDEIQFYHPYFQRDQPEKLKEIKRKVTGSKLLTTENGNQNAIKTDVSKVLADVKQLRNHQQSVDSQLSAIKQENAVLWRELAMLRQKHLKQQQIVNKLIQFLVTIVQPSNRMGGLGVKRRYPLMINGTPHKKAKTKNSRSTDGPTIHELDSADVLSDDLFVETSNDQQQPEATSVKAKSKKVRSPSSNQQNQKTPPPQPAENLFEDVNINSVASVETDIFLDSPELISEEKPEYVTVEEFLNESTDLPEDSAVIDSLQDAVTEDLDETSGSSNKVFLNPSTQDTLLSNLISGSYNTNGITANDKNKKVTEKSSKSKNRSEVSSATNKDMTVATRDSAPDYKKLTIEELDEHLQNTQSELDQLKEVLNGCGSFDANALLGLFSDSPSYTLPYGKNKDTLEGEPFEPGNELATYDSGIIDFDELFDEPVDVIQVDWPATSDSAESVGASQVVKKEPQFTTN